MSNVAGLVCIHCQKRYAADQVRYTCPVCGDDSGMLDVIYDYGACRRTLTRESLAARPDGGIARWAPLLPIADAALLPPLRVGGTPLYEVPALAGAVGVREVRVKDDGRNPTGSLKDRASAVCLARAREIEERLIVAASTGNAASSLAGLCASVGIPTVIFVPHRAPEAKIAQLLIYGARVAAVDGTYDDAFELSRLATHRFGWYSRNTGFNPYLLEGKKTVALEIAEQYGWEVPDRVFVSMGDGCIMAGVWKGFYDLLQIGLIDRMPKLVGVQAEGSNAIARAFRGEGPARIGDAHTVADSISVNWPRAADQALRGLRDSGGDVVVVSDDEILQAIPALARASGVFAEPAGACALAGLQRMAREGKLAQQERVALIVTGNGLKDVAGAMRAVDARPTLVAPNEAALTAFAATVTAGVPS